MSKSAIGAFVWAELSEAQKIEAVSTGRATLKEMVEGLLDGASPLRQVCRKVLANSDVCLERIQRLDENRCPHPEHTELKDNHDEETSAEEVAAATHSAAIESAKKRRQGLPEGYVHRLHKH